jgi:hypothetical protein
MLLILLYEFQKHLTLIHLISFVTKLGLNIKIILLKIQKVRLSNKRKKELT